ncbi:MAG: response regulator [Chloroflexota bacterium]
MMPARILIIEDNETNMDLMLFLLKSFGHMPLAAGDGVEALAVIRREPLDLILCDVHLPHLDGYELARQVKSDPALRPIPLVAVTALAMVGDRDKVLAAGFDGYIAKPIAPRAFIAQVEAFLRPDQHSTARQPQPPSTPAPPPVAKHATILVVDNLAANLDLARHILEPFGYAVITAESVAAGLELARLHSPDLILSDLHLPDQSGLDFIQTVKADPRLQAIPFMFISSSAYKKGDRQAGLDLGAAGFIVRPIKPQQLLAEIEACLRDVGKEE